MKARRGEVWLVDFGMAAKVRPALVVSVPYLDHERALFAVVPRTTATRQTRFEVTIPIRGMEPGAFDAQGLRPVPPTVLIRRLAELTPEQLREVDDAVRRWLGQE